METARLQENRTDEELLREIAAGESEAASAAFRQLYDRHAPVLVTFCASRAGRNQAEDVAQTVWLRVWPRLRSGDYHERQFRSLLFHMAKNVIIDQWRRSRNVKKTSEDVAQMADQSGRLPESGLCEQERKQRLVNCLEKLKATHEQRALVAKMKFDLQDVRTICNDLELGRARVDKLWFEAQGFLRDCVKREVT